MKKILKDPLVHFLLLGLVLFIIYGLVNQNTNSRDDIVIDNDQIQSIIAKWELQWKRKPTQEELNNLLLQKIKQEVFYQEGLKMNLDHNDEIIKRRLAQKMQFLSHDLASLSEPSDKELTQFFIKNSERYMLPYSFTFNQIGFTYDNHESPKDLIQNILNEVDHLTIDSIKSKGDKLPFKFHYGNINSKELDKIIGDGFSERLKTLGLNQWVGPISSGFGEHMVFIEKRIDSRLPELSDVRDVLINDYQYEKQMEIDDVIFKSFSKNYTIEFDVEDVNLAKELKSFLNTELN